MRCKGKIALVTGCTNGIGKETMYKLLEEGADVYMLVRRVEYGEELAKETEGKYPGKVIIYPQLDDLPLLDIHQIGDYDKAFEGAQINGWNREYEEKLYQKLKKGE